MYIIKLIKYSSDNCPACKFVSTVIKQFAVKHPEIEIDERDIADGEDGYEITSVPTIIILEDGKEITRFVGMVPLSRLEAFI